MNELNTFIKFLKIKMAFYDMKCINLNKKTLKKLGVHFLRTNFLQTYCQNRKHFKILAHETVNFRSKKDGVQILSCYTYNLHLLLITKLHNNTIDKICIKYRKRLFGKGKGQKLNTTIFAMVMKI